MKNRVAKLLGIGALLIASGCGKMERAEIRAARLGCLDLEKVVERLNAIPEGEGAAREVDLDFPEEASPEYRNWLGRDYVGLLTTGMLRAWLSDVRQEACEGEIHVSGETQMIAEATPFSLTMRSQGPAESQFQQSRFELDAASVNAAGMIRISLKSDVRHEWCGGKDESHPVTVTLAIRFDGSQVPQERVEPRLAQLLEDVAAHAEKQLPPSPCR